MDSIGICAFRDCTELTSVTFGNSVRSIGDLAFYNCDKLTSVTIPNSVTSIGNQAFADCDALSEVTFGASIESIGKEAFRYCKLREIVLPPALKTIDYGAFDIYSLKSIAIGPNVKVIGERVFDSSTNIDKVYIAALTPPSVNYNSFCYIDTLYLDNEDLYESFRQVFGWYVEDNTTVSMIRAEDLSVDGPKTISLKPGESVQLNATLSPADATLPYVFWHSTNPAIAVVDNNGLVTGTGKQGSEDGNTCEIMAETLYADGPQVVVTIGVSPSGVDVNVADEGLKGVYPDGIYTIQGVCVKRTATQDDVDALAPGLYVINGKKVSIRR